MNKEIKERNISSFDLPLHTAFFALKLGEGEERGQALLSLADMTHLDKEQAFLQSFVSFKTCLFLAHVYLSSGKKYIPLAEYWHSYAEKLSAEANEDLLLEDNAILKTIGAVLMMDKRMEIEALDIFA